METLCSLHVPIRPDQSASKIPAAQFLAARISCCSIKFQSHEYDIKMDCFVGEWRKDLSRCDSMDTACQAVKLPWLLRCAVRRMNLLTIGLEGKLIEFSTSSKGRLVNVKETYPLDGTTVVQKRRDQRSGEANGVLVWQPEDRMVVRVEWLEPYAGVAIDEFVLIDDELHQLSILQIANSQDCMYKTVYTKKH